MVYYSAPRTQGLKVYTLPAEPASHVVDKKSTVLFTGSRERRARSLSEERSPLITRISRVNVVERVVAWEGQVQAGAWDSAQTASARVIRDKGVTAARVTLTSHEPMTPQSLLYLQEQELYLDCTTIAECRYMCLHYWLLDNIVQQLDYIASFVCFNTQLKSSIHLVRFVKTVQRISLTISCWVVLILYTKNKV